MVDRGEATGAWLTTSSVEPARPVAPAGTGSRPSRGATLARGGLQKIGQDGRCRPPIFPRGGENWPWTSAVACDCGVAGGPLASTAMPYCLQRGHLPVSWVPLLVALFTSACQLKEIKECRDRYLESHALVAGVDTDQLGSVEEALSAVNDNLELCKKANLSEETEQLETARRKLESHQYYLRQRESQKEVTPEELEKLANNGDPSCPRGQMYVYRKSDQRIRCTGPQLIQMKQEQAREYFGSRGFKLREENGKLTAEYGSESYHYTFDGGEVRCLKVFAPPGIAWQETASRVTGIGPQRLKKDGPVQVSGRQWEMRLGGDSMQAVLEFGKCEG